jgi:hypothetical protein
MATPAEIEEAKQAAKDARDAAKIEEAYNKSMVNTPQAPKPAPKKLAGGGSVFRSSANGIAQRGKTKGKMVTMCGGGKM